MPESPARDVRIRGATEADLDAITIIEDRVFPRPWSRETFLDLLKRPTAEILLAIRPENRVVGHLVYWAVAGEAEIGNVAVLPGDQGRGIGGTLLDTALEQLVFADVRKVFLEVRESNESALRLYRGRGFKTVGRRSGYYEMPKEDALIMSRVSR
jgi:ribosomal-protein-alanine N-acetyltransferase